MTPSADVVATTVEKGPAEPSVPLSEDEVILQRLGAAEVVRERVGDEEVQRLLRRVAQSGDPTELQRREPALAAALALAVAGPSAPSTTTKRRRFEPPVP